MTLQLQAEIVAVGIVIVTALIAYSQGFLRAVYQVVRFILAVVASALLTPVISPMLPKDWVARGAAAFLLTFIIVSILLSVLNYALGLVNKVPILGAVNKILGGIFGAVKGVAIVWLLVNIICRIPDVNWCKECASAIKKSAWLAQMIIK